MYNPDSHNDKMSAAIQDAELVCKVGFGVLDFIRKHPNECRIPEYKNISQLMLQMALVKLESIITLVKHPIELQADGHRVSYVDPMSLVSTERSLYELLVVHHTIFVQNKTTEQKEIAIKVWENAGLSNRKNILPEESLNEEARKVMDHDSRVIESNNKFIRESRLYKSLDEKGRNKINDSCKKLKPIYFVEDQSTISVCQVSFADAYKILYPNNAADGVSMAQYKKMSFQSHPSYLGILQFGQQMRAPDCFWSEPVTSSAHFCAKLIKEVVSIIPETLSTLLDLERENINIISIVGNDSITQLDKHTNGKSEL